MPAFCRASVIRRSVESALAQTFTDLEVIVVDDGNTDHTVEVLRSIADPRLIVLEHETNRGGNAARQTAIDASRGRWIAFLDSDDVWVPEKLERQLARLEVAGPDYGLCYTWYDLFRADGSVNSGRQPRTEGRECVDLLVRNEVGTFSTMLVSRSALDAVGGVDPSLPSCQDWDLVVRINRVTSICVVPEILVHYNDDATDSGRITTRKASVISGHRTMYARIMQQNRRMDDAQHWQAQRWFIGLFAEHGATSELLRVARDIRPRGTTPADLRYVAHMTLRSIRRRAAQVRASSRSRSRSRRA